MRIFVLSAHESLKLKVRFTFPSFFCVNFNFPPFVLQALLIHTTFSTWTRNNIDAVIVPNVMSSKRISSITLLRPMRTKSPSCVPCVRNLSRSPVIFKHILPYIRPSGRSPAPTANNHSRNSAISSHIAKISTTGISISLVASAYAPTKQQNSWSTILNTRVAVWIPIRVICAMEESFVMPQTWICISRPCIREPKKHWTPISDDEKPHTIPRMYDLRVNISKI